MINKILKMSLKIFLFIAMYLLQIYVFNKTSLFGAKGNLILMSVIVIAIYNNIYVSSIYGAICGVLSDIIFTNMIGIYIIIYTIVVIIITSFKKIYKQDSKMAIIIFSVIAVLVSEIILGISNIAITGKIVNIFSYLVMIIKESIINIFLAYIIFVIVPKLSDLKEDNY